MEEHEKTGILKDNEKFFAFVLLLIAIVTLAFTAISLSSTARNPAADIIFAAKLRILDIAIGGLLTIAGMCAQALFRVSSTDKVQAETARRAVENMMDSTPNKVEVVNTPDEPVPTSDTSGTSEPVGTAVPDKPVWER